jgi:hypothetical protein
MRKILLLLLPLSCLAPLSALSARYLWSADQGGNGHSYEPVAAGGAISWSSASNLASNAGGYLATITSNEEYNFIWSLISTNETLWSTDYGAAAGSPPGPFLGGFQISGSSEPSGGWNWVTGEPFQYTLWNTGEPNNKSGGTENRIAFRWINRIGVAGWNDVPNLPSDDVISYVVEYDPIVESLPPTLTISPAFQIFWVESNVTFRVQYSTNMVSTTWHDLIRPVETNGFERRVFDLPNGNEERFYRLNSP